jgi:hypothetical protein
MTMEKSPTRTGFEIMFESGCALFIFESGGCADFPRSELGGVRDAAVVMFGEALF